jgi:hypothetical protein
VSREEVAQLRVLGVREDEAGTQLQGEGQQVEGWPASRLLASGCYVAVAKWQVQYTPFL